MSTQTISHKLVARFWSKVDKSGACWLWTACRNDAGYGVINVGGRPVRAHRLAYEMSVGAIPEGMVLDHLCRNARCVRPDHLEPVTRRENTRRGIPGRFTYNSDPSECVHGHSLADAYRHIRGYLVCRTCVQIDGARRNRTHKTKELLP